MKKFTGGIALYDVATGSLVRPLTSGAGDSQPSWSPDGKHVAFSRGRSIYVVPAAGGPARRIVAGGVQPVGVSSSG